MRGTATGVLVLGLAAMTATAEDASPWHNNWEQARADAKRLDRPIFAVFR